MACGSCKTCAARCSNHPASYGHTPSRRPSPMISQKPSEPLHNLTLKPEPALADSYVAAGEIEQACRVALNALALGEQLRSARCVRYLREFQALLAGIGQARGLADFYEQARESRLWRIAV